MIRRVDSRLRPRDGNEGLVGHEPFLALADQRTRAGYALLRVDDRSVGGSAGDDALAGDEDVAAAGNADGTVMRFAGLNQLMQPAITGSPDAYAVTQATIGPAVLEAITQWSPERSLSRRASCDTQSAAPSSHTARLRSGGRAPPREDAWIRS